MEVAHLCENGFTILVGVLHAVQVKRMAPTEFEAMAGRGSAKKWKESVKVGQDIPQFQGKPVGAYMRDQLGVRFSLLCFALITVYRRTREIYCH